MAQRLPVSNSALGHLVDVLAVQKLQAHAVPVRAQKISQLQTLIAEEIGSRAQCLLADFEFSRAAVTHTTEPNFGALPFVMLRI